MSVRSRTLIFKAYKLYNHLPNIFVSLSLKRSFKTSLNIGPWPCLFPERLWNTTRRFLPRCFRFSLRTFRKRICSYCLTYGKNSRQNCITAGSVINFGALASHSGKRVSELDLSVFLLYTYTEKKQNTPCKFYSRFTANAIYFEIPCAEKRAAFAAKHLWRASCITRHFLTFLDFIKLKV